MKWLIAFYTVPSQGNKFVLKIIFKNEINLNDFRKENEIENGNKDTFHLGKLRPIQIHKS